MRFVLGMDAGNYMVKVIGPYGPASFLSNICDWFERDIEEEFGPDDIEFNIDGRKGYAGAIAKFEDEFGGGNMMGDSKAHEDAKIRILLALHRYCNDGDEVYLVVGQPIGQHKEAEKKKIKGMLMGRHDFTVNNERKTIFIEGVEVAPEGSAAIWAYPLTGPVKILDCGSGTVNAASILDMRHINTQSKTFNFGAESVNNKDMAAMARGIIKNASKKWSKNDLVLICGGIADDIAPHIQKHFTNAQILRPQLEYKGGIKQLHPKYANAVGFYELAKGRFGYA